jgi:hypothetical protein
MKVTIEPHQNKLRLRWWCPETGERKNLHLGLEESTTTRAFAAIIKTEIENDVKYGYYDPSPLKYRPKTIGKNPTEITTVELFDRFTQHQLKHAELSVMLSARRDRLKPVSDDELVFKSPEGLPIDDRNFNRRAWKTVLAEVGVKYRKPHTTRKTAITNQQFQIQTYSDTS